MYIDLVFLITSAIMLFIGILYMLGYFSIKKIDPKPKKKYGVSILIPMWNEEKNIIHTLD